MSENKPEVRSKIDYLYKAVMDDTDALEDAKMTLEVIKKTDPGVYDEMIDDTLASIRAALSSSILGVIDELEKKEWKGLEADGESQEIWLKVMEETKDKRHLPILEFACAIETKLKEKNT